MPILGIVDNALARYGAKVAGAKEMRGACLVLFRGDVPPSIAAALRRYVHDVSLCVCEICSDPGVMRTWGRLQVRCDRCDDERING